jgi:phosphoribosylanthranilate isomerase
MLTQIYEVSGPDEARAVAAIGIDHVGAKVGTGEYPRELPIAAAAKIIAAVLPPSKFCALFLTSDISLIAHWVRELRPAIVHLGARPELLAPQDIIALKRQTPRSLIMRSVPVSGEESIGIAESYDQVVDFLLLDSVRPTDNKVGALGVIHDWNISRRVVERVHIPVFLAGGLGPDNVAEAIRQVRPAGVDSKTLTDRVGSHAKDLERVRRFHEAARSAV